MNRVILMGNLTRDAELRALPSGSPVLSFGIAVNDRVKNQQSGEWEDRPNFFDLTLFGPRAEKLAAYLTKGTKVAVDGKLRYRSWETPQGEKRSKVEVIVDDIEFMSAKGEARPAASAPAADDGEWEAPF